MIHLLEMLRGQIDQLQETLEDGDEEALKKTIQKSLDEHNIWMTRRKTGNWNATEAESDAKPQGMWKKLFGVQTPKRRR
jgi:hypothetical protein